MYYYMPEVIILADKAKQDRNYYVVKSNALIQKSRFSLSLQAQRCLLFAISRIKFSDMPSTEYTFAIKDICDACGIDMKTHGDYYNLMKSELKALRDNSIWITNEEGKEETVSWFSKVKINKGTGTVSVKFDESIEEYLFLLQNRYTQYKLSTPLAFKSKYSIRLYELLLSYIKKSELESGKENEISFTPDELKERLDAQNYNKFYDFRRFVLEKAVEEINTYSEDIKVSFEYFYKGKIATKVIFIVTDADAIQARKARQIKEEKFKKQGRHSIKIYYLNLKVFPVNGENRILPVVITTYHPSFNSIEYVVVSPSEQRTHLLPLRVICL